MRNEERGKRKEERVKEERGNGKGRGEERR